MIVPSADSGSRMGFPADFKNQSTFTIQESRYAAERMRFPFFMSKGGQIFMNIRNEIKAQIVRAGFTMQELVDRLA